MSFARISISHAAVAASLAAVTFLLTPPEAAHAQLFDPSSFTPIQPSLSGFGNLMLDTNALTLGGVTGTVYNGYAVFAFSSINFTGTITVTPLFGGVSRPVVLISQGDFNLSGSIIASGSPGIASGFRPLLVAGGGGGGSEGGFGFSAQAGGGPGGGGGSTNGGAGGGFGGSGGAGAGGTPLGGVTYGDALTQLQGGSGGGGGGAQQFDCGGGGGGGIALVAGGAMNITGSVNADGGSGRLGASGGGSGGQIYLQGQTVSLSGSLSAQGGSPGSLPFGGSPGGGGGGGRIGILYGTGGLTNNARISLNGGIGSTQAQNGQPGVLQIGTFAPAPEPGSGPLWLAALSASTPAVVTRLRRRRERVAPVRAQG